MGVLFVSVPSLAKFKPAYIQLSYLGITQKSNYSKKNNMTQLKYIGYCGMDYKFWNK